MQRKHRAHTGSMPGGWRLAGAVLCCAVLLTGWTMAWASVPARPADSGTEARAPSDHALVLAPFFIPPRMTGESPERGDLVVCRLVLHMADGPGLDEARRRQPELRDALFYYLCQRGVRLLRDGAGLSAVQEELAVVANSHLTRGRVTAVTLERLALP